MYARNLWTAGPCTVNAARQNKKTIFFSVRWVTCPQQWSVVLEVRTQLAFLIFNFRRVLNTVNFL